MRNFKKAILASLLFICCMSLCGCSWMAVYFLGGSNDSIPKEEITAYVSENVETLSSFPYDLYKNSTDDDAQMQIIKEALGRDTIVKRVYRFNSGIIDFNCGGTGNVVHSTYCGFYYSEKDVPSAFEFENEAHFIQTDEDVFEWESEDHERVFLPNVFCQNGSTII